MVWDQTKPANNSALVSAEVRGNFAAIQAALGDLALNPLQIPFGAAFLSSMSWAQLPTGVGAWKYARSTSDFTKNANTTLADVTGLAIPIVANETCVFIFILGGVSNAAADFKFAITFPAAVTAVRYGVLGHSGPNGTGSTLTAAAAISQDSNGLEEMLILAGLVRNGANAGNVQLQFAQLASDASNSIIRADSVALGFRFA